MKFFFILLLFFCSVTFSQTDKNGNPIFYSIAIAEDTIENFILSSNYYTLKNNIDNHNSSVFLSANPSADQIIEFVRTKPSYFFIIKNENIISNIIMLNSGFEGKKSKYSFFIVNQNKKQQIELPCKVPGDVTEYRAEELLKNFEKEAIKLKAGSKSLIVFGKTAYSIQPFETLKSEIIKLIKKYKLHKPDVELNNLE